MGWQDAPVVGDQTASPPPQGKAPAWQSAPLAATSNTNGDGVQSMVVTPEAAPTTAEATPGKPTASVLERFATGMVDPLFGGAQLAAHLIPEPVGNIIEMGTNAIARAVGAPESPPGLFSGKGADAAAKRREDEIKKTEPAGTDWARLAGNIASPANFVGPTGLLGEGTALARVGSGAMQGAVVAAMQPVVVPNNGSFWTDKIIQGAFGAASGGLMTGSLEVLRPAAKLAFGLHGEEAVNNEAVRGVLKTIQADQRHGGPTFQDMLDIANATPAKPLVVADVGASNLKGMMGRIARTPGDAKQIMAKFLNDRDIDAATRVTGDINQTLGAHAAYYVDQALMDARRAAANPLYEKAFANHEPLDSEYLQHLLDTNPRIQAGMRKGWAIERDEAQGERRPLDATTYGITSIDPDGTINLGQVPNLKLWNVVKKGLDRQIEEHTDKVTGQVDQEGRAIGILKNGMLTELDRLSPDYKAARMAWGGLSESRKALDAGKNIFKMEPEVIDEMVSKMTPNDRQFFQLGAANTIRKMVQKTAESGNEVRPLMVDYTGRQMRAMFQDDKAFERFFAGLNAEHMMWKTWRKAYGGSETAERLADDSAVDANQLSHGIRAGRALMNNDKLSAVSHAFQAAGDWINKVDPRVGVQQSRLLTMPLPQAVRILQGATNKTAPIPKTPKLGGAVGAVAGAQDR